MFWGWDGIEACTASAIALRPRTGYNIERCDEILDDISNHRSEVDSYTGGANRSFPPQPRECLSRLIAWSIPSQKERHIQHSAAMCIKF